jgi:predicted LPLAT superfamily acyltransferase
MNAPAPQHWASMGETTFVAGIRMLCAIERWFGRGPFRVCMYPVVLVHWLANATARRSSLDYLRRMQAAHAVFARAPGAGLGLRHFSRFAETLLDKVLASHGRYPLARVAIERDVMLAQIARGEGGIIVTAHLGCLELCQMLAGSTPGFRLTVLVHTEHAENFNRLLDRLNPGAAVRLQQVTALDAATAWRLGERVAAGEFVAIAGDRVPVAGGRSVFAPFLGRPAPFPIGPYVLAAALGCPLFAMACTHDGGGYRLRFERLEERVALPRANRQAALEEQVRRYAGWLEAQLRAAPLDWFNFFPFWDQVPNDPAVR